MLHFVSRIDGALKRWFADLLASTAIGSSGVALLAARITDLENKCSPMRSRIDQHRAKKASREAFAARVLPRKIERKTNGRTNSYPEQCALPRAT
jgi:hypothetical protein